MDCFSVCTDCSYDFDRGVGIHDIMDTVLHSIDHNAVPRGQLHAGA